MRIILLTVCILIIIITFAYGYFGGFYKINIQILEQGGETVVYESMTGDYSKAAIITDKIYNDLLSNFQLETTKGFGIFYDNPKSTAKDNLRSDIGCILDNFDNSILEKISQKYKVKTLPREKYIVTEIPFKGSISIMVGLMEVYPKIEKFLKKNNYRDSPMMEIYDVPNKKIIYRKEISHFRD